MNADIVMQDVNFAYPTRHQVKILDGLSLTIRAGQRTAIVGSSGSGKSTLVALIERWYELGEADPIASFLRNGVIKIGSTQLKDIDLFWWRSQIGIVQQDLFLFDDTVFNNIAFGLTGTTWESASSKVKERMVIQACKEAYAHEFICLLPKVRRSSYQEVPDANVRAVGLSDTCWRKRSTFQRWSASKNCNRESYCSTAEDSHLR